MICSVLLMLMLCWMGPGAMAAFPRVCFYRPLLDY